MDAHAVVKVSMSSPTVSTKTPTPPLDESADVKLVFDKSLSEDERRFYMKAYPQVDVVRDRKVHCTVCKIHLGTAPCMDNSIKMHPILRVTHCPKCHDFYNSGEFSKGEDGSELYCRWCGQGGEVYCCANCPYVFCKSCIVKNLSRGVVADIEQNENWSCFSCAPKILWPLRAQHWALINYIDNQNKAILAMDLPEDQAKSLLNKDQSTCCRQSRERSANVSDSMESVDSSSSRRSHSSFISISVKKPHKLSQTLVESPAAKRAKTANDEVVCTPDLLSMLEPDCQITMAPKVRPVNTPSATTPRVMSIQPGYRSASVAKNNTTTPPPLVLRNTTVQMRPAVDSPTISRRAVVGPRHPNPASSNTPVYHTINGFRIDLNSAAMQDTFRLPNGKLIQVKRQGTQPQSGNTSNWQQRLPAAVQQQNSARPVHISQASPQSRMQTITIQNSGNPNQMSQAMPQMMRYQNSTMTGQNGGPHIAMNGTPAAPIQSTHVIARPMMVRHTFPDTPIGLARTQLQDQVFGASDICHHLISKVQTLTNSNAYKQAHSYLDIKELYIHLSYLLTYAIGRFKGLQDKCLGDMRQLGFVTDADSLENGQLAAGVDYVRYGKLDDVDLYNTGANSFHNQVYEYRKNLHASLDDGDDGSPKEPLSPLMPLGGIDEQDMDDGDEDLATYDETGTDNYDDTQDADDIDDTEADVDVDADDPYLDDDQLDDGDEEEDLYAGHHIFGSGPESDIRRSTEEYMSREEESHSFDRKLTRLIEQYPSIWCTRHPDYGMFEVTRKQWRTVSAYFRRRENEIKLRWKNIRKRYVRIERRIRDGKRFNGYFDKATNFLANRDRPFDQWVSVDRGESDGDVYKREELDAVERQLYPQSNTKDQNDSGTNHAQHPIKPIEMRPIDVKIINFVKCHPTLWRRSNDPLCNKIDEQTRRSLWLHLTKSAPSYNCDDIIDRWMHLYEMYKTFRLKTIKDASVLANLELKYSKYLAKLSFLYKIDEEELRNENSTFEDCGALDETPSKSTKLQDMPDDKEFVLRVVQMVRKYPSLWNTRHVDYHDTVQRNRLWNEIKLKLSEFQHKQASDDEDNEIEIVEPKTDTITLDSDNDDDDEVTITSHTKEEPVINTTNKSNKANENMCMSLLASILDLDVTEGDQSSAQGSPNSSEILQKKQPRKKTTNKPNPTLIRQKELLERERLEEIKRSDTKLKMKCAVELKKAEEEYPFAMKMLEKNLHTDEGNENEHDSQTIDKEDSIAEVVNLCDSFEDKGHSAVEEIVDHTSISANEQTIQNTVAPSNYKTKTSKSGDIMQELVKNLYLEQTDTVDGTEKSDLANNENQTGTHSTSKKIEIEEAVHEEKESEANPVIQISVAEDGNVSKAQTEKTAEETVMTANEANATFYTNDTSAETLINGEAELDVEKEIEQLLKQNIEENTRTTPPPLASPTSPLPAKQDIRETTNQEDTTLASTKSPPVVLCDAIKELIDGDTNSTTSN